MHINVYLFHNNAGLTSCAVFGASGRESVTIMISVILDNTTAIHMYRQYIAPAGWKHICIWDLNITETTSNQTTSTDPLIYSRQISSHIPRKISLSYCSIITYETLVRHNWKRITLQKKINWQSIFKWIKHIIPTQM